LSLPGPRRYGHKGIMHEHIRHIREIASAAKSQAQQQQAASVAAAQVPESPTLEPISKTGSTCGTPPGSSSPIVARSSFEAVAATPPAVSQEGTADAAGVMGPATACAAASAASSAAAAADGSAALGTNRLPVDILLDDVKEVVYVPRGYICSTTQVKPGLVRDSQQPSNMHYYCVLLLLCYYLQSTAQ